MHAKNIVGCTVLIQLLSVDLKMWTVLLFAVLNVLAFSSSKKFVKRDPASPLFLTPFIERKEIKEARRLSFVTDITPHIRSYSGFITIQKDYGDNLFFWLFPSQNDWLNDPVTIWLEGGPGAPSLNDVFEGFGPYSRTKEGPWKLNEYSWIQNSSLLYIDNPVGAGYSFTEKYYYAVNDNHVAIDMLNMLEQFFQLFPELKQNEIFLAGVSHAGKFIVSIAHAIHSRESKDINLKGIAIGNGWIDPVNQIVYDDYLYQLGLIDDNQRDQLHEMEANITELIEAEDFLNANTCYEEMMDLIRNITGHVSLYNYLSKADGKPRPETTEFHYDKKNIKEAIHVGNATLNDGAIVYYHFRSDIMKSVSHLLEELLENDYRVLLFSGQVDIIVAYPLTINFVKKLNWTGAEEYKTAERNIWLVEDEVAGYTKTVGNFTEILIRDAGHAAIDDQPKWSLDMYNRFIFNKPFNNLD